MHVGQNCFDVKSAFSLIPSRPEDYDQSGLYWQDLYYYDKCLPMGFSSSCRTFEIFLTAHEWIALKSCIFLVFYIAR